MFAQMLRQIYTEERGHVGTILKQAAQASKKVCGCGKWHCELCGFVMFNKRVSRISRQGRIQTGYLTGGVS